MVLLPYHKKGTGTTGTSQPIGGYQYPLAGGGFLFPVSKEKYEWAPYILLFCDSGLTDGILSSKSTFLDLTFNIGKRGVPPRITLVSSLSF